MQGRVISQEMMEGIGAEDSGRMADGGQVLKWEIRVGRPWGPRRGGWAGGGGGRWTTEEAHNAAVG